MCVLVAQCIQLFSTPWAVARQARPSMELSRQEYWSEKKKKKKKNTGVGYNFFLQGIFPTQGSNPGLHWKQMLYCLRY